MSAAPTAESTPSEIKKPESTLENGHAAAAAPPSSAVETAPTETTAEKGDDEETERQLAAEFAIGRMKFLIKDLATEAANRATDLLETNAAMRILINGHFMREHEQHARQDAAETSRAAALAAKEKAKRAAAAATASAAAPSERKRVFSRPLILYTMQQADGAWLKTRILDINPAVPADALTKEQLDDLDLAGVKVLQTAGHYAATGFEGFALVVDALERTERQMICRHMTFARIAHRQSAAELYKIKEPERRLTALASASRLIPFFTSLAIEDLEGKRVLLFRERARLAQSGAPAGTPVDGNRVVTSFRPGDDRELLELKRDKQLAELDAEYVLQELRREAVSYQNYAMSRSAISLVVAALRSKPTIIEHVELQVKSGKTEPTLISFLVKANSIDTSDIPISYASADQLRADLVKAKADGDKGGIERREKLLEQIAKDGRRLSAINKAADGTPLPVGADCVVFELINQCIGIAAPISSMHLGAFPDVLSMRTQFTKAAELEARMRATMTTKAAAAGGEPKMADFDDATMSAEIEALVGAMRQRKTMSSDDWSKAKASIMRAFEEAATNADAAEAAAAAGAPSGDAQQPVPNDDV